MINQALISTTNIKLDTPTNLKSSVQSEKSNSSLSKIEKYISEKYDEVALKHLKEQIVDEIK